VPDPKKPDFLDAAIAKAQEPKLVQVEMAQKQYQLGGNPARPAMIALPTDATDFELLNLVYLVLAFGDEIRARRAPRLEVARSMPNGPMP
jgi:hypothetical protein